MDGSSVGCLAKVSRGAEQRISQGQSPLASSMEMDFGTRAIACDRTRVDLVTVIPLKKDPEAFPRILRNKVVHSEHHSDFRSAIGCTVVVRDVGVNRR